MVASPAAGSQPESRHPRRDTGPIQRILGATACGLKLVGFSLAFIVGLPLFIASLLWWTWNTRLRKGTAAPQPNRSISRIDRVDIASLFKEERPAIITGVVERWPAFARWTPEYLKAKLGKGVVEVLCASREDPAFTGDKMDQRRSSLSFGELIDRIFNDAPPVAELYYMWGSGGGGWKFLEGVVDELDVPKGSNRYPFSADGSGLWVGHAGNITTLHFDSYQGLLVQLRGRKRVLLFPPSAAPHLYLMSPFHFPRLTNLPNRCMTADSDRFPKLRDAEFYEFVLEPGQLLYIPPFWWHEVESLENGISVPLRYDVPILRVLLRGFPMIWPIVYYAFRTEIEKLRSLVLRPAT